MAHWQFTAANGKTHVVSGKTNHWYIWNWPINTGDRAISGPYKTRAAAILKFNETV